MLKFINKLFIKIGAGDKHGRRTNTRGLAKNPLFYYGTVAVFLFVLICTSCSSPENLGSGKGLSFNSFYGGLQSLNAASLFSSKAGLFSLETPDLKIMQGNTLAAVSTPSVVLGKVLGDIFGSSKSQDRQAITDYVVQAGDTLQSVADTYNISLNTLLWANNLSNSSILKIGQTLAVLPVDGVTHAVRSGDTVSGIAQIYSAKSSDIVSFNNLANQDDIYIGDILLVPGGVMPKKSAPSVTQIPVANDFFIYPTQGRITQGLHYYNAIDVANQCGTPIYAAAAGVVQRAVFNNAWNSGMGNYVTILHGNGTVTYYGHFQNVFVKPGDKVYTGQNIGLTGRTGNATGCHLHFQVIGAKNPLAGKSVGSTISYK